MQGSEVSVFGTDYLSSGSRATFSSSDGSASSTLSARAEVVALLLVVCGCVGKLSICVCLTSFDADHQIEKGMKIHTIKVLFLIGSVVLDVARCSHFCFHHS